MYVESLKKQDLLPLSMKLLRNFSEESEFISQRYSKVLKINLN